MTNAETHKFLSRSHAVSASIMMLGLLAYSRGACAQAAGAGGHPQFEPASAAVPAGNACTLHPEGNADPAQSIPVRPDQDGVARFLAVRPTQPDSVDRLALDCTDPDGITQTYSIDLQSDETFAPRPFQPALANLAYRPGLARDPLSYTQEELIQGGYGLRPDPDQNPEGYKRWLAAANTPAYKLRSVRSAVAPSSARRRQADRPSALVPAVDNVYTNPSRGWTGAVLQGSFQQNATAAKTYSYVENEATFNIPYIDPFDFWQAVAQMSIWNGLDTTSLLQAEAWVYSTGKVGSYSIQHQDFGHVKCPATPNCTNSGNDTAAITFTPAAGDTIYAQEWYCNAGGNLDLFGGFACTLMQDVTQGVYWGCTEPNSSDCQSYTRPASDLVNGTIGQTAEFIIENDTSQISGESNSHEWPDFSTSPVTMTGSACVVQGRGVGCCLGKSSCGKWVSTDTDPYVVLYTDNTSSTTVLRGDTHLLITLPTGGVTWEDHVTNVYYWNGSNFNQYVPGCATSIGVGPDSNGLTNGTPWITDCTTGADGNYSVSKLEAFHSPVPGTQQLGRWIKMQDDIATQVAVSPEGHAWAINFAGDILDWNGSEFVGIGAGGCARWIAVGPKSDNQPDGTPWIVGCNRGTDGNYEVYQLQTGGTSGFRLTSWVKMQDDVAVQIAVSPDGIPWVIDNQGNILYWNGKKFVANPTGGCATSIGVSPNSRGLTNGTPWIIGCTPSKDANHSVYQMQTGSAWVDMQNYVGFQIAVSPSANIAWVISLAR